MRQRIRRPQRNDSQGSVRAHQPLHYIVHRAIAAASEDSVASLGNSLCDLRSRLRRGLGGRGDHFESRIPQDFDRRLHIQQSPGTSGSGERIVEEDGLAHLNR